MLNHHRPILIMQVSVKYNHISQYHCDHESSIKDCSDIMRLLSICSQNSCITRPLQKPLHKLPPSLSINSKYYTTILCCIKPLENCYYFKTILSTNHHLCAIIHVYFPNCMHKLLYILIISGPFV